MARIRSRDTRPELRFRKALWKAGHRYRVNATTPVGRPDIVFARKKVAVFVDGCQWHGCPAHYVRPRTRADFWSAKLLENFNRDRRQTAELEATGWRVCRFWEHEVFEELPQVIKVVGGALRSRVWTPAIRFCVVQVDVVREGLERRHMQNLRNADDRMVTEGLRSTRKWKVL
jgi:DNA mismatch endonuclease, patch repair protein